MSFAVAGVRRSVAGHRASPPSALAPGTYSVTLRQTGRKAKTRTLDVVIKPGQLTALLVFGTPAKPAARVLAVAAGACQVLLLLPGHHTLQLSRTAPRQTVRRGQAIKLAPAVTTLRLDGTRRVAVKDAAQLTIVTLRGRRLVAVARSA